MKLCFACLAIIGLAVWTAGCGSEDATTTSDPTVDTNPELGAPGSLEGGTTTGGMDPVSDDPGSEDTGADDTGSESGEGATGGPELP